MASVDPVTVTIRSGHEPSEMVILAPLWREKCEKVRKSFDCQGNHYY